ncbi:MAG: TonB-dependent receptor domain-containing protein [Arenicella sp.]
MTTLYQDNKFKQTLLVTSLAAIFSSSTAFSQAQSINEDINSLDMISVIGQATSGLDDVVSSEELEKVQANDLSDIFRKNPTVSVGGSVKSGQKIYVRNVGEDALNVSVDGAELAGAVFHHAGRVTVDPELLKRVEIEAGAGSATAGPGAIGGAVRFITKDPEDLLKEGESVGAIVKGSYFSNGDNTKVSTTVYGQNDTGSLSGILSLIGSDQDNLEDGDGEEIAGTESEESLGFAKVVTHLSDEQTLSFSHENVTEKGDILYRPELFESRRNVVEPSENNRQTTILNYTFESEANDLVDFSLNLYNTQQEQIREFRGTSYDGAVESLGLTLQNKSQISNHQLIYGINYRDDESRLNDVDFTPSDFKETGSVKGIFLQDIIDLTDKLTVSTGVRYDAYELDDANGLHITDDGISPNLSANYELTSELSISAGYAEALRGPETQDSFRISSYSNVSDLEAETAKNTELGLDFERNNFSLGAGVYRSVIEQPIAGLTPFAGVFENLEDDIETVGYFLSINHRWEKLSLGASFNSAKTEANDEPVTRYFYGSTVASTGDTLIVDLNYDLSKKLSVGWASEFVRGINDINLNVDGQPLQVNKPSYNVHDFYLSWLPMKNDRLAVNFVIKNIFNEQYLSHGSVEDFTANTGYESISGSEEAGRDIRLSVAYRF